MNNFFLLTKVFFLAGFNVNNKKKNQRSAFALFGLTLIIFVIVSFSISYLMMNKMNEYNLPLVTGLCMVVLVAIMLNFVLSMYQLQSIIFSSKDYEFLESLPVSKVCIVSSKLAATYLINLSEDLALIVPASIIFMTMGGALSSGLIAILCAFFASFVPILLSCIIAIVSAILSAKSRYSNVVNIIVSLVFFGVFFGGYMYFVYADPNSTTKLLNVFFLHWMQQGIMGDYLNLLYFLLFNIGGALIVILLVALLYSPINAKMKAGKVHIDYDKVKKETKTGDLNLNRVLLKKEWSMISKRPNYFINSILGVLFFGITAIIFVFLPNIFVQGEVPDPSFGYVFACLIPGMGILMNSIASPASTIVSLEGKNGYELLRCYPINPMDVIKAKLKISIYIPAVLNLVVSTIILICLLIKGIYYPYILIATFLFPQLALVTFALASMLIGLRWPKLNFENDTQVYKNSAAANLPMLFVFLPSFLTFGGSAAFFIIAMEIGFLAYVGLGVITLIYGVAIFLLALAIANHATKLFDKIIYR